MKIFANFHFLTSFLAFCFMVSPAFAAGEYASEIPWDNFVLRVLNVVIFLGIIYYFAGKQIKEALIARGKKVVAEREELEQNKEKTNQELTTVQKRVVNVSQECDSLVTQGKETTEKMTQAIIDEAYKQAESIKQQAHKAAQQETSSEIERIRAKIADEIIAKAEEHFRNIDPQTHRKLLTDAIDKVNDSLAANATKI